MKKNKAVFATALLFLVAAVAQAAGTIYIDANSPNDPGTGTPEDPFRRIQAGIDAAANGNTVQIRPGVYSGPGNYDLDPGGKSITICSIDPEDSSIVAQTIIDPNNTGRGFYISSGEDANCIISGLTIRNSSTGAGSYGGGIFCHNCNPTIRNCVIRDNHAKISGGGICFDSSDATVINCTITGNTSDYDGGGIGCNFSTPLIIGCIIKSNRAGYNGGGIDSSQSDANILNCVIIDNNAPSGGGIHCYFPGVTNLINCTIVANSADYVGGAVYCQSEGGATIKNSILWANSAIEGTQLGLENKGSASVAYCAVQDGQAGVHDPCGLLVWNGGNIESDPCFASFEPSGDPNLWDLHLQSTDGRWNSSFYKTDFNNDGTINLLDFTELAGVWLQSGNLPEDLDYSGTVDWADLGLFTQYYLANTVEDGWLTDASTSPCVDAGDPNSDWTEEPWPNGKRINMGAYGGTGQASKNGNIADLNIDGKVNFFDLAELGKLWGANQETIEDLDINGTIDIGDLDIMATNWLWEK